MNYYNGYNTVAGFAIVTFMISVLLCLTLTVSANAQQQVSGRVTDATTNEPLPGVNIAVKGTTTGTSTDRNGNYLLTVPSLKDTLQYSFIGYKTQLTPVNGRTTINIELQSEVVTGQEMVVVGYGTQSKRNITGSISTINMTKTNQDLPNTNVSQSLSTVPGVQFNSNGRPGQGGTILIRGKNSLSGGNSPLIVLDGIIFNGSLSDINPQDIKTMDILKDASATAIYGSRASNGVILITSKEGTTKKPSVKVNLSSGLSYASHWIKLLSPQRYIERRLDWRKQNGLEADPSKISNYLAPTEAENYKNGITHNPWDIISQQGRLNTLHLSVSGITNGLNYYVSGSYSNDKGLVLNDNQERDVLRANLNFDATDWLNLGTETAYSRRNLSGISANVRDAYRDSPFGTWYYKDGEPTLNPVASERAAGNPVRNTLLTSNDEINTNLFSNLFAKLKVPLFNGRLSYRLNYSPNFLWNHNFNYMRQDSHLSYNNTYANKYYSDGFNWVLENILKYSGSISESQTIDLTLLYSRTHSDLNSTTANANLLSIDGLGYNDLNLGNILTNTSYAQKIEQVSYMGRLNYAIRDKYIFTFTARRDGSSVFAVNNKYATFPSGAFAWIMSDEPFMKNVKVLNLLKLRVSYGAIGNQAIDPYQSLSLSNTVNYVFGNAANQKIGVVNSTLGNDNLKWETTYEADAAVDFGLLNNRITGTIEVYNSNTKNLLIKRNIPVINGYSSILTNIGQTNNKGIEISLSSINVKNNEFSWTSDLAFSHNVNKIVHLFRTDVNHDGKEDNSIANGWFIGKPIGAYYDYVFDGIYQEGDKNIPAGSQPGFVRVKDINGDGKITPADRQVVATGGSPKFQFNLTNRLDYKNFHLSVNINSMLGWKAPFNLINPLVPGRALNQFDGGWWTPQNKSNSRPSLVYSNPLGINWYMSRNFVRINDISFAYNLNKKVLKKIGLTDLRLSVSVKNLYTFTNWPGTDPESGGEYLSNQGSDQLYPMPRTFSLGLNVGF